MGQRLTPRTHQRTSPENEVHTQQVRPRSRNQDSGRSNKQQHTKQAIHNLPNKTNNTNLPPRQPRHNLPRTKHRRTRKNSRKRPRINQALPPQPQTRNPQRRTRVRLQKIPLLQLHLHPTRYYTGHKNRHRRNNSKTLLRHNDRVPHRKESEDPLRRSNNTPTMHIQSNPITNPQTTTHISDLATGEATIHIIKDTGNCRSYLQRNRFKIATEMAHALDTLLETNKQLIKELQNVIDKLLYKQNKIVDTIKKEAPRKIGLYNLFP